MNRKNIENINILYLIEIVLIILGFSIIISLIQVICIALGMDQAETVEKFTKLVNDNHILAMVLSQGLLFIPMLIFYLNKKKLVKETIRFKPIDLKTCVLIIVLTYSLMPIMTFINMLSMTVVKNKISETITNVVSKESILIAVICVAIIPAFVEELLCRGLIYNTYVEVNIKKAVLLSGLMFGLLHCNFNQFAYAFFMGVVFALVVEATDTTLSTIMMHFIINANSLILSYITTQTGVKVSYDDVDYSIAQVLSWGRFALIALVPSILIYVRIAKINGRYEHIKNSLKFLNKKKTNSIDTRISSYQKKIGKQIEEVDGISIQKVNVEEKSGRIIDVYLIIAFIICLIYMIAVEMV